MRKIGFVEKKEIGEDGRLHVKLKDDPGECIAAGDFHGDVPEAEHVELRGEFRLKRNPSLDLKPHFFFTDVFPLSP